MGERTEISCRNGILLLRFPEQEIELQWDPVPECRRRMREGEWERMTPDWRVLSPDPGFEGDPYVVESDAGSADERGVAWRAWRAQLPPRMAGIVERFPSHQWAVLAALHTLPELLELGETVPALLWALAHNAFFLPVREEVATALAAVHGHDRPRHLAIWLGFPDRAGVVAVLSRVDVASVSLFDLRLLRGALEDPVVDAWFRALESIRAGAVRLVAPARVRHLVTAELVAEVNALDVRYGTATADALVDLVRIAAEYPTPVTAGPFCTMRAVAEQPRAARQRSGSASAHRPPRAARPAGFLGSPPLPASETIAPLQTLPELRAEGKAQRNRVHDQVARIRSGTLYAYRVSEPARATLTLRGTARSGWHIGELLEKDGKPAGEAVYAAVNAWLREHDYGRS